MSVAVVRYCFESSDLENIWVASGIHTLFATVRYLNYFRFVSYHLVVRVQNVRRSNGHSLKTHIRRWNSTPIRDTFGALIILPVSAATVPNCFRCRSMSVAIIYHFFELGDLKNMVCLWNWDSICNNTQAITTSAILDFPHKMMSVGYKMAAVQTDVV